MVSGIHIGFEFWYWVREMSYDEEKLKMRTLPNRFFALILAIAVICMFGLPARASESHGKKVHLHGTLIDMTCWNSRQGDTATFLHEHSKACLQMPDCVRSGYAVVTPDGKVYKLDAASNEVATQWIAATQHDADWQVDVKGRVSDGLLDVNKIRLQK